MTAIPLRSISASDPGRSALKGLKMTSKKEIWEVDDGAVDMECYSAQDIKILWILRETNGSDFSFKEFLQNPKVYNKWKSTVGLVVKTSNSIIEGLDGVKGNKYPKDISMVMKKIAWINVKKTGGEARSNSNQLLHHAKENAEIIESQIRELSPDVVILAGTGTCQPQMDSVQIINI